MKITDQQKQAIEAEYNKHLKIQYGGQDKKSRQKLGQFFTPPALSIRMAEKFDTVVGKDILDPTAGAGGLLAVVILCGADPTRVYGIELDPSIAKICRMRLGKLGALRHHIHVGDALEDGSYSFEPHGTSFSVKFSKTVNGTAAQIERSDGVRAGFLLKKLDGSLDENGVKACHRVVSKFVELELAADALTNKNINALDKIFAKLGLEEI